MSSRRDFLKLLLPVSGIGAMLIANEAVARRGGRIRFHGRGLNNSSGYVGPTLSRQELKQCLESQNSINSSIDRLEAEEVNLNKEQTLVDNYSQSSVDNFNSLVSSYNQNSKIVNSKIQKFNSACGNHAYYESDMSAVKRQLGMK